MSVEQPLLQALKFSLWYRFLVWQVLRKFYSEYGMLYCWFLYVSKFRFLYALPEILFRQISKLAFALLIDALVSWWRFKMKLDVLKLPMTFSSLCKNSKSMLITL